MSIVRGCPTLRGPVLANMAVFLAAIPDDAVQVSTPAITSEHAVNQWRKGLGQDMPRRVSKHLFVLCDLPDRQEPVTCAVCSVIVASLCASACLPAQVTRECLLLLRMFMDLWLNILQEQRLSSSLINPAATGSSGSGARQLRTERLLASSSQDNSGSFAQFSMEAPESTDPACFALDLHRLEGVFFMLLCSFDETIRAEAYSALGMLRTLHQQLYTMAEELGVQRGDALQMQQSQPQPGAGMAAAGAVGGSFSSVTMLTAAAAGAEGVVGAAVTPPASSVASGSGIFFRHKATASRDSAEFMQTLGM